MQQVEQLNALLQTDLSNVATTMPTFSGLHQLKIGEIKIEDNKNKDGSNLNIVLVLQNPTTGTDGRPVNAGAKVFHTISLKQTEKYNPAENMAKFREAVTGSKGGAFGPVEQYLDQTVMAQLKVEQSDEYGDRTKISRFVKKAS